MKVMINAQVSKGSEAHERPVFETDFGETLPPAHRAMDEQVFAEARKTKD